MLNNSNKLGALIWNSNSRTKFEFKSRKKKKKTEKGNEEEGLAAQAARLRGPRAGPAHRPHTRLPRSQPLPARPYMSATPVYSVIFLTHASTAYATGARQLW